MEVTKVWILTLHKITQVQRFDDDALVLPHDVGSPPPLSHFKNTFAVNRIIKKEGGDIKPWYLL